MRVIIHPGYSKTATTFLQNAVFYDLKDIDYIGKYDRSKDGVGMKTTSLKNIFIKDFFGSSSSNYNLKVPYFSRIIADYMIDSDKDIFLLSVEEMQDRDTNVVNKPKKYNTNTDYNLLRLKMLFDEIEKIVGYLEVDFLITIREQKEFLASNYAGSYPVFKSAMFNFKEVDTFNRFIEKGLLNKYDNWIGSLFYLNEIEKYENSGMGKVKVMVYEDFRDNPSGFLMELFGFIGSAADPLKYMKQPRQNVSTVDDKHVYYDGNYIVSLFAKIYRLFSLEQSGQLRFVVDRLKYVVQKKNVVEYTDDQIMILDDLYRENNKKLSEKYALDLGKKGYAV